MGRYLSDSLVHMHFAGAGSDTIAIDASHTVKVMFLDISAPVSAQVTLQIGATTFWVGTVTTTPVQLSFGGGRGTGVKGDDVTVTVTAACDVFVGILQIEIPTVPS